MYFNLLQNLSTTKLAFEIEMMIKHIQFELRRYIQTIENPRYKAFNQAYQPGKNKQSQTEAFISQLKVWTCDNVAAAGIKMFYLPKHTDVSHLVCKDSHHKYYCIWNKTFMRKHGQANSNTHF